MFTLYSSDVLQNAKNCRYPHRIEVTDAESLRQAVSRDYVCAEYRDCYRSNTNFVSSDCLAFDCDNDYTDSPSEWTTPEDIREAFQGVEVAFHYSRSNQLEKNGKQGRPKFHVLFPIEPCNSAEEYAALKQRVYSVFPYFDEQALDSSRLFFGTENPEVEYYPGEKSMTEFLGLGTGEARNKCLPCARKDTLCLVPGALSGQNEKGVPYSLPQLEKGDRVAVDEVFLEENCSNTEAFIPILQGQRNTTLHSFAVRALKRFGNTEKAQELFLHEAQRCVPPVENEELAAIWNSALRFYRRNISAAPDYVPPEQFGSDFEGLSLKPPDYSDLGQAKILVKECGNELCFTEATDFLRFDQHRWIESKQLALGCLEEFLDLQLADAEDQLESAKQELIRLGEQESDIVPGKRYLDRLKSSQDAALFAAAGRFAAALRYREFVMQRRDMRFIKSTLDAAKPMVRLDISDLDKDGFLLNTPEVTYDLRKGLLGVQAQDPLDHITKMTAVSPGEQGRQEWEEALQVFFCGNEELIRYVQQVVGLAALGKVYMEAIIIAYGSGKNGKSTFWNTVARVFGSYAGNLSADTLTVGCKRNVKPEMAELKGKRLVIASELEEGMRLNTAMIKQLCSTDSIYCEKKYRDPFSFTPSHTLVLYTNHLPRVGVSDEGTWRRLIVIPFDARIEAKQDVKNYSDCLFSHSAPYIMQWIIEGAEEVIRNQFSIRVPGCVRRAIQNYRDNNDWFANFLDDCCEVNPAWSQKSGELYIEYRTYCARNGEYTRSTTDFYTALELAGFTKHKTNKGSFINGLRLKEDFASAF